MRVYGASPLYNFVELVFRSKRLFIASIVLSTLVTAAIATFRAGSYNATAVILLSGNAQAGPQAVDETQLGSIRYKLNVLNVLMKDPEFFKSAFHDGGLDKGMSTPEFDKFCKDARAALTYNSGENVLEIACRWRSPLAANIVQAFYDAYSHRVLDQETVLSQGQVRSITELKDEYTLKVSAVEDNVKKWKQQNIGNPESVSDSANQDLENQRRLVRDLQNQLDIEQMSYQVVLTELAKTPRTIVNYQDYTSAGGAGGPANTLIQQKADLVRQQKDQQNGIQELLVRYTQANPKVQRANEQLAETNAQIIKVNKAIATAERQPDPASHERTTNKRESQNPAWARLSAEKTDREIRIKAIQTQVSDAQTTEQRFLAAAKVSPDRQLELHRITRDLNLLQTIRDNLASKLEVAIMDEKKDRSLHLAEMNMMVRPEAEPELSGVRNLLFYAAGPIIGLIIAFAFSLISESLDHSIRSPVDVEKYLGKPVLAVLPRMDVPGKKTRAPEIGAGDSTHPSLPS